MPYGSPFGDFNTMGGDEGAYGAAGGTGANAGQTALNFMPWIQMLLSGIQGYQGARKFQQSAKEAGQGAMEGYQAPSIPSMLDPAREATRKASISALGAIPVAGPFVAPAASVANTAMENRVKQGYAQKVMDAKAKAYGLNTGIQLENEYRKPSGLQTTGAAMDPFGIARSSQASDKPLVRGSAALTFDPTSLLKGGGLSGKLFGKHDDQDKAAMKRNQDELELAGQIKKNQKRGNAFTAAQFGQQESPVANPAFQNFMQFLQQRARSGMQPRPPQPQPAWAQQLAQQPPTYDPNTTPTP